MVQYQTDFKSLGSAQKTIVRDKITHQVTCQAHSSWRCCRYHHAATPLFLPVESSGGRPSSGGSGEPETAAEVDGTKYKLGGTYRVRSGQYFWYAFLCLRFLFFDTFMGGTDAEMGV